jgi:hypothetical protein
VSCWGRTYGFSGPFLKQAVNRGRDLLTGPVTMTLTTPAGSGTFMPTAVKPLRKAPNRAELAGTGGFGKAGLQAEWSMWMEYDGLTVATVTLKPAPGGSDVRKLALRIPLRSDVLKYLRGQAGTEDYDGKVVWLPHRKAVHALQRKSHLGPGG